MPLEQPNGPICERYMDFVASMWQEWILCGAVQVLGRLQEVPPPLVVMPSTVESSKPHVCHDERYLNLWKWAFPFTLDILKDVPRKVVRDPT